MSRKTFLQVKLTQNVREKLRKSYGKVVRSQDLSKIPKNSTIFAIGDLTVYNLLKHKYKPKICIIDYRIRRNKINTKIHLFFDKNFANIKTIRNPPGIISYELVQSIKDAIRKRGNSVIVVEGEEDIAALPCAYFAPEDTILTYGLPSKGIALVKINDNIKKQAKSLLKETHLKI